MSSTAAYNKAYFAAYYQRNGERIRKAVAEYQKVNRETVNSARRAHYYGPDGEADRARYRRNCKLYRARHPEKKRESEARRRALMAGGQSVPYRTSDIFDRDAGRCHVCKKKVDPKKFHVDHLIPISCGGPDAPWNVAVAHPFCNQSRGAGRTPAQLRLA